MTFKISSSPQPTQLQPAANTTNAQTPISSMNSSTLPTNTTVRGGPLIRTPSDKNVGYRITSQAVASSGGVSVGQFVRTLSDDKINGNFKELMSLMPQGSGSSDHTTNSSNTSGPALPAHPHPSLPVHPNGKG